jgi:Spy/CpxP family protein refolding chaperone
MRDARLRAATVALIALAAVFAFTGCSSSTTTTAPGGSTGTGTGNYGPGNMMGGSSNTSQTGTNAP